MLDVSLTNYKLVASTEFAYVADTSRRGDKVALAFNDSDMSYLISSIYTVFKVKDINFEDIYENEIDKIDSKNSQTEKNTPKGGIKAINNKNLKTQDKTGSVSLILDK